MGGGTGGTSFNLRLLAYIIVTFNFILRTFKGPKDPSVIRALDKSGVIVDTVCFTSNADKAMRWLAENYRGEFYFDNDQDSSNSLNEAFLKDPCGCNSVSEEDIPIFSGAGLIPSPAETVGGYLFIDESVGVNTRFLIDYGAAAGGVEAGVFVFVTSPNGEVFR